jgi:hypothetical protein
MGKMHTLLIDAKPNSTPSHVFCIGAYLFGALLSAYVGLLIIRTVFMPMISNATSAGQTGLYGLLGWACCLVVGLLALCFTGGAVSGLGLRRLYGSHYHRLASMGATIGYFLVLAYIATKFLGIFAY